MMKKFFNRNFEIHNFFSIIHTEREKQQQIKNKYIFK